MVFGFSNIVINNNNDNKHYVAVIISVLNADGGLTGRIAHTTRPGKEPARAQEFATSGKRNHSNRDQNKIVLLLKSF